MTIAGPVWREGDRIRRADSLGYADRVSDGAILTHAAEHLAKRELGKVQFCIDVLQLRKAEKERTGAMSTTEPDAPRACPVAYCRGEAGHRDLHDIPACLGTCGPLRPGLGREHDPACPNATWRRR